MPLYMQCIGHAYRRRTRPAVSGKRNSAEKQEGRGGKVASVPDPSFLVFFSPVLTPAELRSRSGFGGSRLHTRSIPVPYPLHSGSIYTPYRCGISDCVLMADRGGTTKPRECGAAGNLTIFAGLTTSVIWNKSFQKNCCYFATVFDNLILDECTY